MPVVKGGVWTNIEDEILKASVSKYGLNQWARVSSLLARKTPKQCKARWSEWLDPSIKKIEWSKEEDEKLLHLAKLMPTQWRTIAPIVGRTATQCLERYQKLLDEAEARENDDLGLIGPGGEAAAPSADDVRRLRPGEVDPDPESKPAKPDTVDMDEDEKEMLSEARARLANTQGKKAKRKARERQLEESRRLANLQKRRELKSAGINIKITNRKQGQMDYNADIPFEKAPAPGFYDTQDEQSKNERAREQFDPRKQQLANKRKQDQQDGEGDDRKRRKNDKTQQSAAAAQRAGQMQKIREAERIGKRRALNLPAPQVTESELEDIVKMGMAGERASQIAGASDNEATKGLVGNYSSVVGQTPIRTPRAPQEEDRIANEIRNARARTETQSALLGGDNPDVLEGDGTTGYGSVAPSKQQLATPNPMATPLRQGGANGTSTGATPMRTPRDNFRLNDQTPVQSVGQTPREVRLAQEAARNTLKGRLAALPRPRQSEFELEELPLEQEEVVPTNGVGAEDASIRDQRNEEARLAAEREEFKRQTQVYQRALPRPLTVDADALLARSKAIKDPTQQSIAQEAALLIINDTRKFGGAVVNGTSHSLTKFSDDELLRARMEVALELGNITKADDEEIEGAWTSIHGNGSQPSLVDYSDDVSPSDLAQAFEHASTSLTDLATTTQTTEKSLSKILGGYQARARTLRQKTGDAYEALKKTEIELATSRHAQVAENAGIASRLEKLRGEVEVVARRERIAQEVYRERKVELEELGM